MEARCSLLANEWHGVIVCIRLVFSLLLSGKVCVCVCMFSLWRELPLVLVSFLELADLGETTVNESESLWFHYASAPVTAVACFGLSVRPSHSYEPDISQTP